LSSSHYLHGTTPDEQARLDRMNTLLNTPALCELQLAGGERVLDVGSGLGQFSRGIAKLVAPTGTVIGVERSAEQIAAAERLARQAGDRDLVEFRQGDATALPLRDDEWGRFDVAHTRFLLEHVPDPLAVVRGMVRAVRPGGRVVLQDDGHDILRLWPEPAGFQRLWSAYLRTYDRVGNDPYIGHRLVSLLVQAGAQPRRNNWLFFGSCAGHPDMPLYVENLAFIVETVRDQILALGEFDGAFFDAGVAAIREWANRPDAAIWYAVSWAEGVKE
jgi:ubiquinone/menaquinone biosynthesis C-methylase UbiE